MPNTLHHTEGSRMLGEPRACMSAFKRSNPVVVDGLRRHNEQRGHWYGHQVTEAFLGSALALHVSWLSMRCIWTAVIEALLQRAEILHDLHYPTDQAREM